MTRRKFHLRPPVAAVETIINTKCECLKYEKARLTVDQRDMSECVWNEEDAPLLLALFFFQKQKSRQRRIEDTLVQTLTRRVGRTTTRHTHPGQHNTHTVFTQ